MTLPVRVRRFIEERDLLHPGDTVVVAVSGGPDSLCLLDILHKLDWGLTLHVAHLNHGLRPEAARDAEFVRAQAAARGLSFHLEKADTRAYAAVHKLSVEEAARELRYAFLAHVAAQVGTSAVAVAHTADDQAETVLMHFLRGSGLAGLKGMLPKSGNSQQSTVIRPLLSVTRAEVEAYCAEHGLHPVRDASNADTTLFRNRLRHELLPALEAYNQNIRAALARAAEVLAGEYELAQRAVAALWEEVARVESDSVMFDRARWQALSVPEQRGLLRRAVQHLRPGLRDIDFAPLDAAVRFSRAAPTGRACDVADGLCLAIEYDAVVLREWQAEAAPGDDVPQLADDGALQPGWEFRAESVMQWTFDSFENESKSWRVFVDADKLPLSRRAFPPGEGAGGWGLRLRARNDGDRFQPLGLGGHSVKVSDFMINRKVPAVLRDRWPLVVCGDAFVWLAGLRLDERFKVTPATRRVLKLDFIRSHS